MKKICFVFCLLLMVVNLQLKANELEGETFDHAYRPGDHELLLMPTAYTMKKGSFYFSDYELFFLNLSGALTSRTHVGLFTLFPITEDFLQTLTLGIKQNYLRVKPVQAAFWASYTPDISGATFGNVFSIKNKNLSFHLGLGGFDDLEDKDDMEWVYMAGINFDVSSRFSLMTEFTNLSSWDEEDFDGLFSIGLRFRSERLAWDIGGVRPLGDSGDLIFFPLLKGTILLGSK